MKESIILRTIDEHKQGLSITEIVSITKIKRSRVRIALARLEGNNSVIFRKIGMAKVYYYNHDNGSNIKYHYPHNISGKRAAINHPDKLVLSKASLIAVIIIFPLLLATASRFVGAATIDVSQQKYITDNNDYDRSPTMIYAAPQYWLFYTKAKHDPPAIRSPDYEPDSDNYLIYYKKAASIDALNESPEYLLEQSNSTMMENFPQRKISATYFHDKIYLFTSTGYDRTDSSMYYYSYDPASDSWAGPFMFLQDTEIPPDQRNDRIPLARGGDISIASDDDWIYAVWSDGSAGYITTWNGTDYGTVASIIDQSDDMNKLDLPKITLMKDIAHPGTESDIFSNILCVVGNKYGPGTDLYLYCAYADANPSFSMQSVPLQGIYSFDANIFYDGESIYVTATKSDMQSDHIIISESHDLGNSWSEEKDVTYGIWNYFKNQILSDFEVWDDWDSAIFHDDNGDYIYYSTESNDSKMNGDSEIAYLKFDWDVNNSHYISIQNAIYQSSDYDEIKISNETYSESLTIDNPIILNGSSTTLTSTDGTALNIRTNNVMIQGFNITGSQDGIMISTDFRPSINPSTISVENNNIVDNDYAIINNAYGVLDASHNFWGNAAGPTIVGAMPVGRDNFISGNIIFSPWYSDGSMDSVQYQEVIDLEQQLDFDMIKNENSDPDNVTSDLSLVRYGPNGTAIDWESSNPDIIRNDGKVIRPETDTQVSLTATIGKKDSISRHKTIELTVLARAISDQEAVDNAYQELSFDSIRQENSDESEISSDLHLMTVGPNDVYVSWISNDTNIISDEGTVIKADYDASINLTANISKGDYSETKEFILSVSAISDDEEGFLYDAKSLLSDKTILNGNPSNDRVLSGLYLPRSYPELRSELQSYGDQSYESINQSYDDVAITWSVSDDSLVSLSDPEYKQIVFSQSNDFNDMLNENCKINRHYDTAEDLNFGPVSDNSIYNLDYGPILSDNMEFYCGSCSEADMSNPLTIISQDTPFCGYYSNVISSIIKDKQAVCAITQDGSGKMYDMRINAFRDGNCLQDGIDTCVYTQYRNSYSRSLYPSIGDVNRSALDDRPVVLTATIGYDGKSITKNFYLNIKRKEYYATYNSSGIIYHDTSEYVLGAPNINHVNKIIPLSHPLSHLADSSIVINMQSVVDKGNLTLDDGLLLGDEDGLFSVEIPSSTTILGGDLWNGLFTLPRSLDVSSFIIDSGIIDRVMDTGWVHGLRFSDPVKIIFHKMTGRKAAFADGNNLDNNLTRIETVCNSASDHSNIHNDDINNGDINNGNINNDACYYDNGSDLIIWSYQTAEFIAYTPICNLSVYFEDSNFKSGLFVSVPDPSSLEINVTGAGNYLTGMSICIYNGSGMFAFGGCGSGESSGDMIRFEDYEPFDSFDNGTYYVNATLSNSCGLMDSTQTLNFTINTTDPYWHADRPVNNFPRDQFNNRPSGNSNNQAPPPISAVACKESWKCSLWNKCDNFNKMTRTCSDSNDCGTANDQPILIQPCIYLPPVLKKENTITTFIKKTLGTIQNAISSLSNSTTNSALFDIVIDILKSPTVQDKTMLAKVSLVNFGVSGDVNAKLVYTIKDSKGVIMTSYEKNIPVETQREFIETINLQNLDAGSYTIFVELKYSGQKEPAIAQKDFSIANQSNPSVLLIMMIFVLVILLVIAIRRKFFSGSNLESSTASSRQTSRQEKKRAIFDKPLYSDADIVALRSIDDDLLSHEAQPGQAFILINGSSARSLKELSELLKVTDDNTYSFHANSSKNDFAAWTKEVFHYDGLAELISRMHDRESLIRLLDKKYKFMYRD